LARIHRDRLRDAPNAEEGFRRLFELDAGNAEAVQFLGQRAREREDWRALYDLRVAATEASWDPNQRLTWTREAADLATDHLGSVDLAVEAWERLWRLGDAPEETEQ